jgi:ankyrin repeat protein
MAPDIETPGATPTDPLQAALLRLAICCGDGDAVRRCLDEGADPNGRDAAGNSPFMLAASLGQAQLCAVLLARGADPTPENRDAAEASAPADPASAEAEPTIAVEAFSDRAYRIAKALLAANAPARPVRAPAV